MSYGTEFRFIAILVLTLKVDALFLWFSLYKTALFFRPPGIYDGSFSRKQTSLLLSGLLLSLVDSSKSLLVIKMTQLCQHGIKPAMLCEGFKEGRNTPISVTCILLPPYFQLRIQTLQKSFHSGTGVTNVFMNTYCLNLKKHQPIILQSHRVWHRCDTVASTSCFQPWQPLGLAFNTM